MPVVRKALMKRKERGPVEDGSISEEEMRELIAKDERSAKRDKRRERIKLKKFKDEAFKANLEKALEERSPLTPAQMAEVQRRDKQNILQKGLERGLEEIANIGEFVDRFTGAPMRAAFSEAQEGRLSDAPGAFIEQFGDIAGVAPTGQEIVRKGFGTDPDSIGEKALGLGFEMALDPFSFANVTIKSTSALGKALLGSSKVAKSIDRAIDIPRLAVETKAGEDAFRALSSNSSQAAVNKVLQSSTKTPHIVGRSILDNGLGKHLNDPDKMIEAISGKPVFDFDFTLRTDPVRTSVSSIKRDGSGVISKLSDETTKLIDKAVESGSVADVNVMDFKRSFIDSMEAQMNLPGNVLDENKLKAYSDLFDNTIIKENPTRFQKVPDEFADKFTTQDLLEFDAYSFAANPERLGRPTRSLSELQALKRGIGKKISEKQFNSIAMQNPADATQRDMLRDIYTHINKEIQGQMDGVVARVGDKSINLGSVVAENNADISNLIEASDMLMSTAATRYRQSTKAQKIVETLGGTVLGAAILAAGGSPVTALLVAGGAGKFVGAARRAATEIPAASAKILEKGASIAREGGVAQLTKELAGVSTGARAAGAGAREENAMSFTPRNIERLKKLQSRRKRQRQEVE